MLDVTARWLISHKDLLKEGRFDQLFPLLYQEINSGIVVITADLVKSLEAAGIRWLTTLKYIPQGSYYKSYIKQFDVPKGIVHIEPSAFEASKLESVSLPEGLTDIDQFAFSRTSLKEVHIPKSVRYIGEAAFTHTGIESLDIKTDHSDGLKIQRAAFYANSKLETVNIECANPFRISGEAFSHCSALKKVVLGRTLQYVGQAAFYSCPLEEIEFKGTKAKWLRVACDSWNMGTLIKVVKCKDGEIQYLN